MRVSLDSVAALAVGVVCAGACVLLVRSANAFNDRPSVRGEVVNIGEGRDAKGEVFSTADVEWKDASGLARTHRVTSNERFAFHDGQHMELKVDPNDPTEVSTASVGGRTFFATAFACLSAFFVFVGTRGVLRSLIGSPKG